MDIISNLAGTECEHPWAESRVRQPLDYRESHQFCWYPDFHKKANATREESFCSSASGIWSNWQPDSGLPLTSLDNPSDTTLINKCVPPWAQLHGDASTISIYAPEKAPLHPSRPWEHLDYACPFYGKMVLIIVDAYSNWLTSTFS